MKPQRSCVLVLGLLLGVSLAARADEPGPAAEKDARPAKPDSAVIAAWEKAGAMVGWMSLDEQGDRTWRPKLTSVDDILIFHFSLAGRSSESLRGLPQPGIPFDLVCGDVTDAGLKELARLKQLQSLNLYDTQVTDAGLKELVGLKQLQSLSLGDTQVTDAGLKELKEALPKCEIRR